MRRLKVGIGSLIIAVVLAACSGGGSGASVAPPVVSMSTPTPTPAANNASALHSSGATPTPAAIMTPVPSPPPLNPLMTLGFAGFSGSTVATLPNGAMPRQLAALPNGDLLIGTGGTNNSIYILPNAEAGGVTGTPTIFATLSDLSCDVGHAQDSAQGVAYNALSATGGTIYVGRECGVYSIAYKTGDQSEPASAVNLLFPVRTGAMINLSTDGDVHHTTSVTVAGNYLYTSVGSSCNACTETDPTRAVVLRSSLTGSGLTTVATRVRNLVAITTNPNTGTVWAGGAGQDCLETTADPNTPPSTCLSQDNAYINGHPYEWLDAVSTHSAPADYMWPGCEEDAVEFYPGYTCANMTQASVYMPAYSTILGAAIYPKYSGTQPTYAFPSTYQGAMFVAMHGSWHETTGGTPVAIPQVALVPLNGDAPATPMNWSINSPYESWARANGQPTAFLAGFQLGATRIGRPVGVAVGSQGSLFISDDYSGAIYRIRYINH